MTKFFQTEGLATVVWDPERNAALCEFTNRMFETDDERTIEKLKALGYSTGDTRDLSKIEQVLQIEQINRDFPATPVEEISPQAMAEKAADLSSEASDPDPAADAPSAPVPAENASETSDETTNATPDAAPMTRSKKK